MFSCLWDLLVLAQETCHLFMLWCAHVPVIKMLCVCACASACLDVWVYPSTMIHFENAWFLLSKVCPTNGRY